MRRDGSGFDVSGAASAVQPSSSAPRSGPTPGPTLNPPTCRSLYTREPTAGPGSGHLSAEPTTHVQSVSVTVPSLNIPTPSNLSFPSQRQQPVHELPILSPLSLHNLSNPLSSSLLVRGTPEHRSVPTPDVSGVNMEAGSWPAGQGSQQISLPIQSSQSVQEAWLCAHGMGSSALSNMWQMPTPRWVGLPESRASTLSNQELGSTILESGRDVSERLTQEVSAVFTIVNKTLLTVDQRAPFLCKAILSQTQCIRDPNGETSLTTFLDEQLLSFSRA